MWLVTTILDNTGYRTFSLSQKASLDTAASHDILLSCFTSSLLATLIWPRGYSQSLSCPGNIPDLSCLWSWMPNWFLTPEILENIFLVVVYDLCFHVPSLGLQRMRTSIPFRRILTSLLQTSTPTPQVFSLHLWFQQVSHKIIWHWNITQLVSCWSYFSYLNALIIFLL